MIIDELFSLFDVIDIAPDDFPVRCCVAIPAEPGSWPRAALPESGRIGCGCSANLLDAQRAAVGEAIEIASLSIPGNVCHAPELDGEPSDTSYPLLEILGFSPDQIANRKHLNDIFRGLDNIPKPSRFETADWVMARDAWRGSKVFVPSAAVFLDYSGHTPSLADTNGCAAAENDETAKLRAVLEAIERDAVGRWWYARRRRAGAVCSDQHLFQTLESRGFAPRLYDITSDIGVPVVAAAGTVYSQYLALGFGAGLTMESAADKALMELAMMALKIEGALFTGKADATLSAWISGVDPDTPPLGPTGMIGVCPNPIGGLDDVLNHCSDRDIRLAFLDQSASRFGLKVWRAVSPDLCHWKPRFGRTRLLAPEARDISRSDTINPVLLRI